MIREVDAKGKACPYKLNNPAFVSGQPNGYTDTALASCMGGACMAWVNNVPTGYSYLRGKSVKGPMPPGMMQVDYEPGDADSTKETHIRIAADPAFGYCRLVQPDFPEGN